MIDADDRPHRFRRRWHRVDTAAGGLALDLGLYATSAAFALVTALTSTLTPHRAWGAVAAFGYLAGTLAVLGQLVVRRSRPAAPVVGSRARLGLTVLVWAGTALVPLLWQSGQRAAGRTDRAQEEVVVIEESGIRLLDHGTPYLGPDAIAALPPGEQLLGYTPYQPGMALFGLPRAAFGAAWWTDARLWFALVTAVALVLAVRALLGAARPGDQPPAAPGQPPPAPGRLSGGVVRAVQAATVLPLCALTLATGGDDLPVLALCLLALTLAAVGRPGRAGIAVGLAAALKLFAWPVALVLIAHAVTRRVAGRMIAGAVALPVAALLPALLVDRPALVENVLRFPLGQGLVSSPAASPFPGYLIANNFPAGRAVAAGLLVAVGLAIGVGLLRRPPRTAATTALICGYGLLAAIALMPSTRFGYLLYPVALLVWAPVLVRPGRPLDGTGPATRIQ